MWPSDNHLPGARPKTGPPRPDRPLGCDKGIDSPPKIPPAFRFRPRRRVWADCLLCKSVATLSWGPDRGGRSGASPVTPDGEGRRGGRSGAEAPTFSCGMPAACLRHAGRSAGARGPARVRVRRPGGRTRARAWAGVRVGVGGACDGLHARAYACVRGRVRRQSSPDGRGWRRTAEGRPTEPRSPSVAGPLPQNSGVTSKIVGRQRSRGDFDTFRSAIRLMKEKLVRASRFSAARV